VGQEELTELDQAAPPSLASVQSSRAPLVQYRFGGITQVQGGGTMGIFDKLLGGGGSSDLDHYSYCGESLTGFGCTTCNLESSMRTARRWSVGSRGGVSIRYRSA
jgi:hypothetical protein